MKIEDMGLDQMTAYYIRLRDKKKEAEDALKESLKPIAEAMERLENEMLSRLHQQGVDSAKTEAGTAYINVKDSVSVKDRDEFLAHVVSTEQWELLDVKCNKTVFKELADSGEEIPGVKYTSIEKVGVRRS